MLEKIYAEAEGSCLMLLDFVILIRDEKCNEKNFAQKISCFATEINETEIFSKTGIFPRI